MKKLIPILVLSLFGTIFSNAQIKNYKLKKLSQVQIDPAILPPKNPKSVKVVDAHYKSPGYVRVEREYLRTNGFLIRSYNNFNRNFGSNLEVQIYTKCRDSKKVDDNQIKLTWRIPESRSRTFYLQNVSDNYKPQGILITRDYEVYNMVFGVSIALIPNSYII